jgi:branched-chain amino acid transport system permease protein
MQKFLNAFVSGVDVGAVIALVALGFLILYKATNMFNFAQGALLTLGAYVAVWSANDAKLPLIVAYLTAIVAMFLVGVMLERVSVAGLRNKNVMLGVMATFGASYVISTVYEIWQGPNPKYLASIFPATLNFHVGPVVITPQEILVAAVCGVIIFITILVFQRTAVGREVRAVAADREVAQLYGVNVRRLSLLAWGTSAALAGVAAVLISPLGAVDPSLGAPLMLSAFAAATLGGFGNIGGAMVGALFLGLAQQLAGAYVNSAYAGIWPFVIMIIAIAVRPQGLLARATGQRL